MKANQSLSECALASVAAPFPEKPSGHILVAEDDGDLRYLNMAALTQAGYQVDTAVDGAAAWQALNARNYDLMITDQNMPKVSGVELLKKIHAARMTLPIIMATGISPAAEFTHSPWLQPAAVLLKPYTLDEMLRTVKKILAEADARTDRSQLLGDRTGNGQRISLATAPGAGLPSDPTNFTNRILVVDEDQDLRQMYAEALAGPGYQVDGVADGAAGWEALQTNEYQLLITEHDLPKLTGVELIRKARAAHLALPIVMITNQLVASELVCDPALQLAATLRKPFPVDTLLSTVKSVLPVSLSLSAPSCDRL